MDGLLAVPVAYRWAVTLLFVGLIVGLSVTPGVERPDDDLFSWLLALTATPVQKFLHVAIYAVLAALWMWTLAGIPSLPARIGAALLLSVGLGIALEWYQTSVPGRYGSVIDVLLNSVGAAAGVALALLLL